MKKNRPLLSGEELIEFCTQMAQILKAGYSLEEGLVLLSEDKSGLEPLLQQVRSSGDLAAALKSAGDLPDYFLRMIHLGQETGRLEDVLQALGIHYRRELALRRGLRDALGYPALMLLMVLIIMGVLLQWVLPLFQQAYAQLGASFTGLPRLLLELGQLLGRGGWLVLPLIVLVVLIACRFTQIPGKLLKKLPFFRSILEKMTLSRLTGALALGLSSGLSTHYALDLASEMNRDPALESKLRQARDLLNEGEDLAEALRRAGILRGNFARQVLLGRRTGSLDAALAQISQDCREEADLAIDQAIASIEPMMVLLLSLLVGILLLSILLPMLGLLSTL